MPVTAVWAALVCRASWYTVPPGDSHSPLLPNVESREPFAVSRARRNSLVPLFAVAPPPTRILPSGWRAIACGKSPRPDWMVTLPVLLNVVSTEAARVQPLHGEAPAGAPGDDELAIRLDGDGGRPVVGGVGQVDDAGGAERRVEQAAGGRGGAVLQTFDARAEDRTRTRTSR